MMKKNHSKKFWFAVTALQFIPLFAYGHTPSTMPFLEGILEGIKDKSNLDPSEFYASLNLLIGIETGAKGELDDEEIATLKEFQKVLLTNVKDLRDDPEYAEHEEALKKIGDLLEEIDLTKTTAYQLKRELLKIQKQLTLPLAQISKRIKDKKLVSAKEFFSATEELNAWLKEYCEGDQSGLCSKDQQALVDLKLDNVFKQLETVAIDLEKSKATTGQEKDLIKRIRAQFKNSKASLEALSSLLEKRDEVETEERILTQDEVNASIGGFTIGILVDSEGKKHATPSGAIPSECFDDFEIVTHEKDLRGSTCQDAIGFSIKSKNGPKCVEDLRKAGKSCKNSPCKYLSDKNIRLDLSPYKEVRIALVSNKGEDLDRVECHEYNQFENLEAKKEKIAERKAEARNQKVADAYAEISCRGSDEHLDVARAALETLLSAGKIDQATYDANLLGLELDKLKLLESRIHTEPKTSLPEIRAEILAWADSKEGDLHDQAITALRQVSHRYLQQPDVDLPQIQEALETNRIARALNPKKELTVRALERERMDLRVQELTAMAQHGTRSNPHPWVNKYEVLLRENQSQVFNCERTQNQSEDCTLATQRLQVIQQIPQQARDADQRHAQQAQQFQHSFQHPGMQNGMSQPYMSGMTPVASLYNPMSALQMGGAYDMSYGNGMAPYAGYGAGYGMSYGGGVPPYGAYGAGYGMNFGGGMALYGAGLPPYSSMQMGGGYPSMPYGNPMFMGNPSMMGGMAGPYGRPGYGY